MGINAIGSQMKLQGMKAGKSSDRDAIERKIEQLKKQLQQIKENQQLSPEEKEKRIDQIQKQIDQLQQQKTEAAKREKQQDTSAVQSKKVQEIEKTNKEKQAGIQESSMDQKRRFDTFENESEPEASGVYALSHDEEGNAVIKFDDPSKKEIEKQKELHVEHDEKKQIVKTTGNTDAVDREIQKLKESLSKTKQQLSSTSDPKEIELLENKVSQIEAELKQKDNDTYRQQHMQITEQKNVASIGE